MFEWTQKRVCELIETARNAPSRRAACREFAARHNLTEAAVLRHLYKLIRKDPELDRELPRGKSPIKVSVEQAIPSVPEDGFRELSRLQEIITTLTANLHASEAQTRAQAKSFEARERLYQATIDRLTVALEGEKKGAKLAEEWNQTLKAENDHFANLIAQGEKLAGDRGREIEKLKLELIALEELAQAILITPKDLSAVIERVAEKAAATTKAAEKAVADVICDSVIYRTWRDRVAQARSETRLNLLKKLSVVEANAPHDELRQLQKQLQGARKINLYLMDRLSRQRALA